MHISVLFSWLFSLSRTSAMLLAIVLWLAGWLLSMKPWRNLPPGPPILPIVGSLPYLPDKNIRNGLLKLTRQYGDVMTFQMGQATNIVLSSYDVIREALVKHGSVFSARPVNFITQTYGGGGKGLTTNQAESYQTQRRFVLHVLRDFGLGKSTMDDIILAECNHLISELQQNVNAKYDPEILLKNASSNIINVLAFGERREYDDPVFVENMRRIARLFRIMGGASPLVIFPYLRHLPGDLFGFKQFQKDLQELKAQYQEWIDKHKAQIEDGNEPTDLIGRYLVQINKTKDNHEDFSEAQLIHIIGDLFLAATDTSSSTLYWIILYLALHPRVQDKVYSEIQEKIGSARCPQIHDRPHLHYTEAVIAEVMRIANVAPFTLPHAVTQDITLKGYLIPKGAMVGIFTHSVDMDPNIWTEPEKFDPERFINAEGNFQKKDEQILFSMGKRSCIGEGLARKEIFLFLTNIVHKFRITLPEDEPTPSTEGLGGGIFNPEPYDIILKVRE